MLVASKCTAESLWIHIPEITLTPKIFFYVDCSAVARRLPFSLLFLSLKFLQCNYTVTADETHFSQIGSLYSKSFLIPGTSVPFSPSATCSLLCATLLLKLAPHLIPGKTGRMVTETWTFSLALNSDVASRFSFPSLSAVGLLIPPTHTLTGSCFWGLCT